MDRLARCYSGNECAWERFYKPKWERANLATRYHLVYPSLAYYVLIKQQPRFAKSLRPQLDTIYRALLEPRTWSYWHSELGETTWPLQERNLTYAGRLATFIGFYIDAFGVPPSSRIELDGKWTTYRELSETLFGQAAHSPCGGVTCYNHQSMTMCNAHLLINNLLHDRLYGTSYAAANGVWLSTLDGHLLRREQHGPLFYYGTKSHSCAPDNRSSLGMDVWTLFLMSAVVPDRVAAWFKTWRANITTNEQGASVDVQQKQAEIELSSKALATAWAFCLAKELGLSEVATDLRRTLEPEAVRGFQVDPLISGLYLLGDVLDAGAFHALVTGHSPADARGPTDA